MGASLTLLPERYIVTRESADGHKREMDFGRLSGRRGKTLRPRKSHADGKSEDPFPLTFVPFSTHRQSAGPERAFSADSVPRRIEEVQDAATYRTCTDRLHSVSLESARF
jgi:hypothetical protein